METNRHLSKDVLVLGQFGILSYNAGSTTTTTVPLNSLLTYNNS